MSVPQTFEPQTFEPGPPRRGADRPPVPLAAGNKSVPETLPARIFLLAYDPAKGRLVSRSKLGPILRAAALADLSASGRLLDDNHRVIVAEGTTKPSDPVLANVFAEISHGPRRKWTHWVGRRHRAILREVRDQLESDRVIRVETRRLWGVVPAERITLRRPLVRRQLLQSVTDTLRPAQLVTRIDLRDAALVVLAATGDLRTVLTKEQRRAHKDRLAQLAVRVGPVVPALRKTLQHQSAAAAAG